AAARRFVPPNERSRRSARRRARHGRRTHRRVTFQRRYDEARALDRSPRLLGVLPWDVRARRRTATPADQAIAHGVALRRERKDAEALAEFRRAYALSPTPHALGQIALAEAALDQWVSAENDLLHVLVADDPWVARQRSALEIAL